jgi:hypothetical protein
MFLDPVEVLILALLGFAAGYGVREWVSRRRHRLYRESHWMHDVILFPEGRARRSTAKATVEERPAAFAAPIDNPGGSSIALRRPR